MSVKTTKKGATAPTTKKALVGTKMTGKDKAGIVMARLLSKLYGFGTDDKYASTTDYCLVSFFV